MGPGMALVMGGLENQIRPGPACEHGEMGLNPESHERTEWWTSFCSCLDCYGQPSNKMRSMSEYLFEKLAQDEGYPGSLVYLGTLDVPWIGPGQQRC